MKKRYAVLALLAVGLWTAKVGWADTYPSKPITIVVPVAPGGNVDTLARLIAKGMSEELSQPVIVENKAGAGSTIGTRHVARAAPDGYTLLAIANTFVSVPEFVPDAGYDPLKDFVPVTQTCRIPMVLVTGMAVPETTVQALIARARAQPEAVTLGSSGLGSTGYIAGQLLARQANVKFLDVYYKGNSQALLGVLSGQLTGMFDQVSTAGPNIKTNKLRALGVTTNTRSSLFPDVPTIAESGFPGFEDETFNAIMAPAGTPAPVIARLHAVISKVLNQPALHERLAQQGIETKLSETPEKFTHYLQASVKKYRAIAADAPIQKK